MVSFRLIQALILLHNKFNLKELAKSDEAFENALQEIRNTSMKFYFPLTCKTVSPSDLRKRVRDFWSKHQEKIIKDADLLRLMKRIGKLKRPERTLESLKHIAERFESFV